MDLHLRNEHHAAVKKTLDHKLFIVVKSQVRSFLVDFRIGIALPNRKAPSEFDTSLDTQASAGFH